MARPPRTVVRDLGFRALNALHGAVLRSTRGRWGASAFGMPVVELQTTGRRSGHPHRTLLTVPVVDGDTLILVASKGGDTRHPDWYRNLVHDGSVVVTRGGERLLMRARVATAEERQRWWPLVIAAYRPYGSYQRRAQRDVPLVLCQPAADDLGPSTD